MKPLKSNFYSNETEFDKKNRIKLIQKELGLPMTGNWDRKTNALYADMMKNLNLDSIELSKFIVDKNKPREIQPKETNIKIESTFPNKESYNSGK